MTQNTRVLNYLKTGQWLSTVDAVRGTLGEPILRLAARIDELREGGYAIISERVEGKTYHRYRLVSQEPQQTKLWHA